MRSNIFAYTAPGASFPEYLSVNRLESGRVELTVRSAPGDRQDGGATASIELKPDQAREFAHAILSDVR